MNYGAMAIAVPDEAMSIFQMKRSLELILVIFIKQCFNQILALSMPSATASLVMLRESSLEAAYIVLALIASSHKIQRYRSTE